MTTIHTSALRARLLRVCAEQGISQQAVAELAGVSRNTISNIVRDENWSLNDRTKYLIGVALDRIEDGHSDDCVHPDQHAALYAEIDELRLLIARVRADCEAQTLPETDDVDRKVWSLGVWAQAQRVLNILDSYPGREASS